MTIRVGNNIIAGHSSDNSLPSQTGNGGKFLTTDGTTASWNSAVDYTNITNCLTEIPQDIKLELKDGVLTLKAGSKVYVPSVFEMRTQTYYAWTSEDGETYYTYTPTPNVDDPLWLPDGQPIFEERISAVGDGNITITDDLPGMGGSDIL